MGSSRNRILLVRLGSLGDIVHGLPVAASLRAAFPDARIDWLVDARYRAVLEIVPVIDRRVVIHASTRSFLRVIRELRRERYDVALDLQGLWKSGLLARGSGARRVIGFPKASLREPGARHFYTESCAVQGPHVIDKNLSLLGPLGLEGGARRREFPLDVPESRALAQLYRKLGREPGARFLVINPGGGWPNKRWKPEWFGRVAIEAARRHDLQTAVVWGPGEEALAEAVASTSEENAVVAPATRIADLVAIVRAATLVVSGDSGPLHLAAAVGTPVVGLFGPTDEARNGPWGPEDLAISRYQSCECHYKRRCARSRPCVFDIGVDAVADAVAARLSRAEAWRRSPGPAGQPQDVEPRKADPR